MNSFLSGPEGAENAGAPPLAQRRRPGSGMTARRTLYGALVLATMAAVIAWMGAILGADGFAPMEIAVWVVFALTTPYTVTGFWNAVIGLVLVNTRRDWLDLVVPILRRVDFTAPITTRTAIIMPAYNEDPDRVFRHLAAIAKSLACTGAARHFELHLLSDTQDPAIAAAEERHLADWQDHLPGGIALHYRRRVENTNQKVGNVAEFLERRGDEFEHMIVLDADSVMSGEAILRMVRIMDANPRLGILQTLVVGLPTANAFARIFQFGMRQGLRPFTIGAAWWQGDHGPYWGHNAIVRIKPFREHCELPVLPGSPPLGGRILSHDQVEAVLMRRAGFGVRVLPIEDGSYEENPPTLPDFIKRDMRWCQGNMQYFGLLGMPGLKMLGRIQLGLAIMMYLSALLWFVFMAVGIINALTWTPSEVRLWQEIPEWAKWGLFAVMMTMVFSPKITGFIDICLRRAERRKYKGIGRVLLSSYTEMLVSMIMAPIVACTQSIFIIGLFLGRKVRWGAQNRDGGAVSVWQACQGFWAQSLVGLGLLAVFGLLLPGGLLLAIPVIAGLMLAVPYAVITSHAWLGDLLVRLGIGALPEETAPPALFADLELRALHLTGTEPPPPAPPVGGLGQPLAAPLPAAANG